AARMLTRTDGASTRSSIVRWHDQAGFSFHSEQPVPIQIDGEGLGTTQDATFTSHPSALLVMGP
ncbi:MAG: diacylglycerol kinase family lipid kinase, partial [Actinomycetota bacterium]|nr:diacylglycerol kinase family lipid kinase [Actinomycetota bacterium]